MENTTNQPVINTDLEIKVIDEVRLSPTNPPISTPPEDLLKALYHVLDTFENCGVNFFLDGITAEQAIKNHELRGDRVHIGLRKLIYASGAGRMLDTAFPTKQEGDKLFTEYMGVPIEITLYDDSEYILSPDSINYRYENFHIPNPYHKFKELQENG